MISNQRSLVYRRTRQEIYHTKRTNRASIIGFYQNGKEDADKYKNIDDFVKEKEIGSNFYHKMRSGMLLKNTMKSIRNQQIELTAAESFKVADAYALGT